MAELFDTVVDAVESAMAEAMQRGEDVMRDVLDTPGPEPSAPGQPPRKQSGRLHDACGHHVERNGDFITGALSNNAPYAADLIEGTATTAPRDFLTPVRDAIAEQIPSLIARRIVAFTS